MPEDSARNNPDKRIYKQGKVRETFTEKPRRGGNEYVAKGSDAGGGRGGTDKGDLDSPAKDLFKGLGGIKKAP